jgi:hypothetical protein
MKIIDHPYKPKAWAMALASLFFAAIAAMLAHEAMTNDRGLVLNGIIHFSESGATTFYWCIAALSALFVAVGVPAFFLSLTSSHRLVLTDARVSAPKFGFSREPTVVPLSSIIGLDLQEIHRQRMLHIRHKAGRLTIMQSWLPDKAAFDGFVAALSAALQARAAG